MLGFAPLASAPLADDGAVVVNVGLTADSITAGAPQIGDLFNYDDYSATASSLFDNISSTNVDLFTNNRGYSTSQTPTVGHVCLQPNTISNLSVNSSGISFRFSGQVASQYSNGNWYTNGIYYSDITLSWTSSTVVTATTATLASSLPSGSGTTYNINFATDLASLNSAIDTQAAAAGVSSNLYSWIPSEVTVTNSSNAFAARVAGSSTDSATYTFSENTSNGRQHAYVTFGDRFLIQRAYPNQNVSTSPNTEITVARFTSSIQQRYEYEVGHSQNYNLAPIEVIADAPVIDASGIVQLHNLATTEITASAPTVDVSGITQAHSLTATEITAGAPTLDASISTQDHNLVATEIIAGAPTVDAPNITQVHNLDATEITASAPTVDTSGITQDHSLVATEITAGTPTVSEPSIGFDLLIANDITGGTPTVDAPTLSEDYQLTTVEITASSPAIDAPSITQAHNITLAEITSGAPVLSEPQAVSSTSLIANDIATQAPVVDSADIDHVHVLTPNDIISGSPITDAPAITQAHDLSASDIITGAPVIDEASEDDTWTLQSVSNEIWSDQSVSAETWVAAA